MGLDFWIALGSLSAAGGAGSGKHPTSAHVCTLVHYVDYLLVLGPGLQPPLPITLRHELGEETSSAYCVGSRCHGPAKPRNPAWRRRKNL
jgi:hypothetical protein